MILHGPGGLWWPSVLNLLSHLRGSGLTPGQSNKTLSATQLRRKGRKKRKKEKIIINKVTKIKIILKI